MQRLISAKACAIWARRVWNAFKTLTADLSDSEKDALCRCVATETYRLGETR